MKASSTDGPQDKAGAFGSAFSTRTFSSLQHLNFRYLWTGTMLMSAGQWIQQVTLGWLLYDLTGSSVLLGLLNGARTVPFLLAGPFAGVAADRVDRRRLLMNTQYLLAITALIMGGLVASEYLRVWHLFVFTLITGLAWTFTEPARQSLVPNMVPKKDLMNAVAINSAGFNLTKIVGPSLGGFLIVAFGVAGNFFVQGLVYVGVLVTIFWMRVPPTPDEARRASVWVNLREGLAYVWSTPVVLALMLLALVPRIFAVPYQTLMPVFQKDVLGVGPEGLGVMLAAPGLGAVVATVLLAGIAGRFRRTGVFLLGVLVALGLLLIFFAHTTSFPLALIALVGVGGFQILFMAVTNIMLQVSVPDSLRGRVMGLYMLDRGVMPLGSLLAGVMAHFIGAPATVSLMALAVIVLAVLIAWRVPAIRDIRI